PNRCQSICSRGPRPNLCWWRNRAEAARYRARTNRLANVFYVAGDAIIDGVAFLAELAIVMPGHIPIGVKCLADNCAGDIRIAIDSEICARCVEDGGRTARRIDIDVLRRGGV